MYNVSDAVIEAWKDEGVHKEYRVVIGGTSYGNDKIVDDSLNLKQAILDDENFETIGCIASSFSCELRAQFPTKQRDKRIKVFARAGDTTEIQIFDGYINKCTKTANGWRRTIEAYDYFYQMSGQSGQDTEDNRKRFDITDWYNEHADVSLSNLLSEVCSKFSIPLRQGNRPLETGSVVTKCGKEKKASSLSALDLIKAIMQLNGCFGYITSDGYFSWKYLWMPTTEGGWLYPSTFLFPETTLYPGYDKDRDDRDPEHAKNFIGEYESLEYQDFKMLPITKVIVRESENDEHPGEAVYSGQAPENNTYIVQGNILMNGVEQSVKETVAHKLFQVLNSTWYVPFTASAQGLPYLEPGDEVNFYDFVDDYGRASMQRFFILSRTLSGGQHLKDSWEAQGNEYQHEFVSGSGTSSDMSNYDTSEEVDEKIAEAAGLFRIVSINPSDIPSNPDARTLYCIQGEVVWADELDEYDPESSESPDIPIPDPEPEPEPEEP